ncbi:unnamed protein product [Lymnaea stagnalis]|uniref:Solute carrier family 40 member n=1 Tax=Lymnaea stagnalis TaxID=6523 RepID=A0AAV2H159_LYMST
MVFKSCFLFCCFFRDFINLLSLLKEMANLFVYFSHFLSSWGDRMWSFGVGLFLIKISPESLQLTAVHGLSMGLSVLFLGALVGDIVDETPRLKAAQTALLLQNLFVVICAVVIYLFLMFTQDILAIGEWTRYAFYALVILLCVLSRLTSMARQIAVEKDWIVQMCGKDTDLLATMTSLLRFIDLTTQVLAPIATGLIMSYGGVEFGALFIGAWNLGSVFIEYYFLWKVYNTVPALKKRKDLTKSQADETKVEEEFVNTGQAHEDGKLMTNTEEIISSPEKEYLQNVKESDVDTTVQDSEDVGNTEPTVIKEKNVKNSHKSCRCTRIFSSLERLYKGWPVYVHYDVRHAGLALACLYMTVLGFDSVTVGYAKMQGLTEALVGGTMGVAAFFGIFGTVMYQFMRRGLGLQRTGMFGLSLQISCLTLCVVSVWMPGTPFNLSLEEKSNATLQADLNCTQGKACLWRKFNCNIHVFFLKYRNSDSGNETNNCIPLTSNISIWMLLAGIVTARFGLWVADLSISQIFMESVQEKERGKVNGVQNSLNQLMDMLKYLMVVLAPHQHQFGLLVIISFCFICLGWLFYAYYLRKSRGHFFHFEKCVISGDSPG